MARHLFDLGVFGQAPAATVTIYTDRACTTVADIQTTAGAAISGAVITVSNNKRVTFYGPNSVRTLYAKPFTDTSIVVTLQSSDIGDAATEEELEASSGTSLASLTPTATKTGSYTASVGDLAMMNAAGGGTALTLPTAPADKAQVGYRAIGATVAVPLVITAGGSDTIGTSGATTASIPLADEVGVLQYQASSTRWLAVANVKTQASLDARFQSIGATAPAVPPTALSTFKAAHLAAAAGSGVCKIHGLGDSVLEGTGQTDPLLAWLSRFATKWRASFRASDAANPLGWRPFLSGTGTNVVYPWVLGGSPATAGTWGLRGVAGVTLGSAGQTLTATLTGTSIDVWYTTSSSSTGFTVTVDGGSAVTYGAGTTSVTTSGNKVRVSLGASGSHTVVIGRGTGNSFVDGVTVYDGNETVGYQVFNAGRHGTTTTDWLNTTSSTDQFIRSSIETLSPDLSIVALGLNDESSRKGAAQFATQLEQIADMAQSRFDTSLLILGPHQRTTDAQFSGYQKAVKRAAGRVGAAYLDMSTVMPVVGSAGGNSSGYYFDSTGHLTATGADVYAQAVKDWLVNTALPATA